MKTMRVRATQNGYYGNRERVAGEVFHLHERKRSVPKKGAKNKREFDKVLVSCEQQFSENWMEKVEQNEPRQAPTYPAPGPNDVARAAHEPPPEEFDGVEEGDEPRPSEAELRAAEAADARAEGGQNKSKKVKKQDVI